MVATRTGWWHLNRSISHNYDCNLLQTQRMLQLCLLREPEPPFDATAQAPPLSQSWAPAASLPCTRCLPSLATASRGGWAQVATRWLSALAARSRASLARTVSHTCALHNHMQQCLQLQPKQGWGLPCTPPLPLYDPSPHPVAFRLLNRGRFGFGGGDMAWLAQVVGINVLIQLGSSSIDGW